jgi:hypothetical protein
VTTRAAARAGQQLKRGSTVTRDEILKLEHYLKKTFQLPAIQVRQRPQKEDSAEVYIGEEFIGVLFRDDEDEDETAYQFQMAILDFDLQ